MPGLKEGVGRLWKLKMVEVVLVMIGPFESVTEKFDRLTEKLRITYNVGVMQKSTLLGPARILRKVFGNVKKRSFC